MILPLPVPPPIKGEDGKMKGGTSEKDVRFINLEGYPDFFKHLGRGFPRPPSKSKGPAEDRARGVLEKKSKLAVVSVGSFEASFVPTVSDFDRLDARFRLPKDTWKGLPQYRDYGFAVFKLKKGNKEIHPMAFDFPLRRPGVAFFPTVHIHDGKVHERARFDHSLYCQQNEHGSLDLLSWRESPNLAQSFMTVKDTQGLISAKEHVFLKNLRGKLSNQDTIVSLRK